jgi:DNA repair exonuclease SbcCD ATPase subunit
MLSRLYLKNFKVFEEQELEFGPGSIAIVGPNGSGKTSILESIEFALFKQVTRKEKTISKVEELIRHGQSKAKVELVFVSPVNRREYLISRTIHPKGTNADLFIVGESEPVATGPQKVDAEIIQLLGMDRHAFSALTYVRQGEIDRLSRLAPKGRRSDLYSMMGLGVYDKTQDLVKKKGRDLSKMMSSIEQSKERLESIKSHLPERESIDKALSIIESLETSYPKGDLDLVTKVLESISESLSQIQEQLDSKELSEQYEEYKEQSGIADMLQKILDAIPDIAESQLRPHIRHEAREIFRGIFGDRYSDLLIDDDYSVSLFDLRGNKVPLSAASGGEDVCVNFALRVAVNTALQKHSISTPPPGLIILDEPGAGLDSRRRRWLPEAVASLKSVEQVIVVTHMDELRESAQRVISLTPQGKDRQPLVELIH